MLTVRKVLLVQNLKSDCFERLTGIGDGPHFRNTISNLLVSG